MLGSFKVPSLRNTALTPPYMHGGQLASLEEVLEHYSTLEESPREGETDSRLQPLGLTEEESSQLVAFLESLTGAELDPWVLPPEGWEP
jgi:cytochrome c peroxidase